VMLDVEIFADKHAQVVDGHVSDFENNVSSDAKKALAAVVAFLSNNLPVTDDSIDASSALAMTVLQVPYVFETELRNSGYYRHTFDFVQNLDEQIDLALEAMIVFGVVGAYITPDQQEFLVSQKLTAKAALDVEPALVQSRLAQFMSGLAPGQRLSEVVDYVTQIVQRLLDVVQKAQLLITSFFRKTLAVLYVNHEKVAGSQTYTYVGPADKKNRPFCAGLIAGGRTYLLADIELMDNGQLPGVLENAGGYGCRHWWALTQLESSSV
jgi:hypothetical protein